VEYSCSCGRGKPLPLVIPEGHQALSRFHQGFDMRSKIFRLIVLALGIFALFVPAFAHHGEANYDTSVVVDVKGKITDFQFINPHVLVYIDAKNQDGTMEKWTCEATSPNMLYRRGWTKTTLKPGDEITATGHRAKNGNALLRLMKIAANGKEYDNL
jgi:Family of unknown function (DUF6152)